MSKPTRKIPKEPKNRFAVDLPERYWIGFQELRVKKRIFENRKLLLHIFDWVFYENEIPGFDKPKD